MVGINDEPGHQIDSLVPHSLTPAVSMSEASDNFTIGSYRIISSRYHKL